MLPVNGAFSRPNPVAGGQPVAQTPQQMFEKVQHHKEAADWYKRESQAVEAEKHYKVAREVLEEVMKTTSIDFQTVKMFESIYSEYSGLLKALGRTAEAAILDQKERALFERDTASGVSSRKREVERGSSSEHLNKKNYAAIPGLRSAQRLQDTVLSNGIPPTLIPLQQLAVSLAYEKNAQIDYLFEKALSTLGSLEVSNKPSLFLMYAHDNSDHGEAKASTSKDLIKQLSKIQVILYSDQAPTAQPYSNAAQEEQEDARLENILSNQLCLLPTQLKKGVKPVDKVVVCCSEVLGSYLEKWPKYETFYQELRDAYLEDRKAYLEGNEQASAVAIRQVVRKFSQAPAYKAGFHHVLTEMAFLEIRAEERGEDKHGIIPVSLTPDSYAQCLGRFITSTTVRMEDMLRFDGNSKAEQDVHAHQKSQHIVLFKLIERLLASSDEAKTFLSTFWKAYTEFVSGPLTPGGLEFTRLVDGIFDDIRTALHSQLARDLPKMRMLHAEIQKKLLTSNLSLIDLRKALYQHYQLSNLSIQRISGDKASLDDCYINLAIVESQAQREKDKKELEKQAATFERLPSSERLEATNPNKLIELEKLFEAQKLRDGSEGVPKRILIQGRAGIGKTTLCKKLVYEYHRQNGLWQDRFESVLWVPLRQLKTHSPKCLEDLLCTQYFAGHERSQAQALSKIFYANQNKTLFILDGLDEVVGELNEGRPLKDFLQILLNQPYVVITSRPAGVDANLLDRLDLELETVGFSPDNVQAYIEKFAPESNQAAIEQFIRRTPLIQGLVNIPIQLDALCYSWDRLPQNKEVTMAMLYGAMVDKLWRKDGVRLEKEEEGKVLGGDVIEDLSESDLEELMAAEIHYLGYLAFKGLETEKIEFSREELSQRRKELNERSQTGRKLLLNFTRNLKKTSYLHTADVDRLEPERHYHFLHLTFQEFFAAKFLVEHIQAYAKVERAFVLSHRMQKGLGVMPSRNELEAFIATHKYNPRYEIVWWMVAGLLKGVALENFFNVLNQSPRDLIGIRHQQVMMGCLNEARTQLKATTIAQLENELMQWLDFEMKNGKRNYSRLGSQRIFPEHLLLKRLDQVEGEKKTRVVATLGARPALSADAVQALISSLKNDDKTVRDAAASALGHQSTLSVDAVQALISSFKDENWNVRSAAARALGSQSTLSADAVQALISSLTDDDETVRSAAARALGSQSMLSADAIQALISSLTDDNEYVREAAESALGSQSMLSADAIQTLLSSLKDENWNVRDVAARALSRQSTLSADAVQALISSLKDENWNVRDAAARALSRQSTLSADAVQALISSLKDENWNVRDAAARALDSQSTLSADAVQALISSLTDENWSVRYAAESALGSQSTRSADAVQALISSLTDDDKYVRSAAARALGRQSALLADAVQALISSLTDDDETVRDAAARALGRQSTLSADAVQALISSLTDDNEYVREAAESALGSQSTLLADAVQALISSLKDDDEDVRYVAARALGSQSTLSADAVQALISSLTDDDEDVRDAAARALGSQSTLSADAVQALISSLTDDDEDVRYAAARALGSQSTLSADAVQALISSLTDGDEDVRSAAARALGHQSTLSVDAVQALISSLTDDDEDVRSEVARALGSQSTLSVDAVQALISSLTDDDKYVRSAAARALVHQSTLSADAAQALISSLTDDDKYVRSAAARALGSQSTLSVDAVQALISSLKDGDEDVRSAAASALGSQSTLSADAVLALISSFKDENWNVRSAAASALGSQSTLPADAVLALISFLTDDNEDVRSAAARALGRQSTLSADAVLALISSFKDENWNVRSAVEWALGSHMNQLFTLLACLERNQVGALYTQVLFPHSCEQIAPLYIQAHQLHFYTTTGPGQPIQLTSEQRQVIIDVFKTVQAEAGIISLEEGVPLISLQ